MQLKGAGLDVLVYPSDIAISGSKDPVARARAAIAAKLIESPAYLTASAEAEKIEDKLGALLKADAATAELRLTEIDGEIARLAVPFDEWETVYRQRLQVERNLLARELRKEEPLQLGSEPGATREKRRLPILDWAIGLVSAGLLALDVGLLLARRRRPRRD
jgi:hypothetical protein